MADLTQYPDPSQRDLYWSGYSGWAMVPGAILGAILSGFVLLIMPFFARIVHLDPDWVSFITFQIVIFLWIIACFRWGYLAGSFTYRLTPISIYLDFGFFYPPTPSIALEAILSVDVKYNLTTKPFKIGQILLITKSDQVVRLPGIFKPELFAKAIMAAKEKSKK